jgi:hypothetical protein
MTKRLAAAALSLSLASFASAGPVSTLQDSAELSAVAASASSNPDQARGSAAAAFGTDYGAVRPAAPSVAAETGTGGGRLTNLFSGPATAPVPSVKDLPPAPVNKKEKGLGGFRNGFSKGMDLFWTPVDPVINAQLSCGNIFCFLFLTLVAYPVVGGLAITVAALAGLGRGLYGAVAGESGYD